MSHFKQYISNEFLPSIPSFLISFFSPLYSLFSWDLLFFLLSHTCSFVPTMFVETLFSLQSFVTVPLSEFSCQNISDSVLISLWHSSSLPFFKFIPRFSNFCNVRSITANHPILFSSRSLWAIQTLLHSYVVWTLGVNIQKNVFLQFCLGLCWI